MSSSTSASSLYKQLGLTGAGSPLSGRHLLLLVLAAGFLALTVFVVHPNEFRIQSFFAGGGCSRPSSADASSPVDVAVFAAAPPGKAAASSTEADGDDEVRILIGIQTLPSKYARRHLLRSVYALQVQEQPSLAGRVDVWFVFCNVTSPDDAVLVALEILRYGDILVLDCAENMDNGKTHTFFSTVARAFNDSATGASPRYEYVMKADDDTYLRLAARRGADGRLLRAADAVRHGELLPVPSLHVGHGVRGVVGPGAVGGVVGAGPARAGRAGGHVDGAVVQPRREGQEPVRHGAADVQLQGRVPRQLLPPRLRPGHHRRAHAQGRPALGRDAHLLQRHRRAPALRPPLPPAGTGAGVDGRQPLNPESLTMS